MTDYRRLIRELRKRYPKYSVMVRRVKLPDTRTGYCYKIGDNTWRIDLNRNLSEPDLMLWLAHEMAHVPSWPEWERTGKHGRSWSWHYKVCYGIYEQVTNDCDKNKKRFQY